MIDYQQLYQVLAEVNAERWVKCLPDQLEHAFDPSQHGDLPRWQAAIETLPVLPALDYQLNDDTVRFGSAEDDVDRDQLKAQLMTLHPWRKGPFEVFGVGIDTEWRSDWKWTRLQDHIAPLSGRLVLDVGCGNGYHCWRMFGAGARGVVGIDPTLLSVMQFQAMQQISGLPNIYVLPLSVEAMPYGLKCFDSVFSMGVLYHRRSPLDHLLELRDSLRPGGELILETLVVDGDNGATLVPEGRYAKMRNVWFIPSCDTLMSWMRRCGFTNIRLLDVTTTTVEEQRSTEWMRFHSLTDFLDPANPSLTIEGLPAPRRALIIANTP